MASDEHGDYDPDAGNKEPQPKKCNALLVHWRSRYGEPRYCSQPANSNIPADDETRWEHDYCWVHKCRYYLDMKAKELMEHGLNTQSIDHLYNKLDPWQQVFAWGCYESLLEDSQYDFTIKYKPKEFDFEDEDFDPTVPEEATRGENIIIVDVPRATEKADRAFHLWFAAVDTVKMMNLQATIAEDGMSTKSTEYANFTTDRVPGESGGEPKSWQTLEELKEHHLNLPYSRLVKDRKELLKYGGVEIEGETNDDSNTTISFDEDLLDETAEHEELHDETPALDMANDLDKP